MNDLCREVLKHETTRILKHLEAIETNQDVIYDYELYDLLKPLSEAVTATSPLLRNITQRSLVI